MSVSGNLQDADARASSLRHSGSRHARGFTLVETLVVLVICVGLVILMGTLYRAVGQSAVTLRSGDQEWLLQRQMREQMLHLLSAPKTPLRPLSGGSAEFIVASWQSKTDGADGKPVLASYRYDKADRTLHYREQPLPPWWETAGSALEPMRLQSELGAMPSWNVLTGVEKLSFRYLPDDSPDMREERWQTDWQNDRPPRLIQLQFTRAGRHYSIIFEARATDV